MGIPPGAVPLFFFLLFFNQRAFLVEERKLCGSRYEPLEVFCLLGASSSAVLLYSLCLKTGDTFPHELPAHP